MANEDVNSVLELIRQLGERMNALTKLSGESVRQLAERSALLARMHTEAMAQFGRSVELAERIAARIQMRQTQA